MDNHVHLVVMPKTEHSLTRAISETHQLYTRMINFREGWRGCLWQGRFKSNPMDGRYLYQAVRYVERNPVRAKMVKRAEEYRWSSAKVHVGKGKEKILSDFSLLEEVDNWSDYLREKDEEEELKLFRQSGKTGRPIGSEKYLRKLESQLGRTLVKQKPGPRCK
jgi:putative transposase